MLPVSFWIILLIFQSTPSAWRETIGIACVIFVEEHFNPLPPHGGRLVLASLTGCTEAISIHSLRMEGDMADKNTRTLDITFQSTPSAWRETL